MKTPAWVARIGLGLVIVVLTAGMTVLVGSSLSGGGWCAEPGNVAADFRLLTESGKPLSLSELRGEVVALLVVPADRPCPPDTLEHYRRLMGELPTDGLRVLAVTTEPNDPLLRDDLPGTTLLDRSGSVASQYMVRHPTWFVIDATGTIRHRSPASATDGKLLESVRGLVRPSGTSVSVLPNV